MKLPLRWPLAISILLVTVTLTACGSGEGSSSSDQEPSADLPSTMSKAEIARRPEFKIKARTTPIPKQLVIKDLWKGFGAIVGTDGETEILVDFASADYGEAVTTPRSKPSRFALSEVNEGWKGGLRGMRVGGRRELIIPNLVDYGNGTAIYLIDLLTIFPQKRAKTSF